MCTRNHNHCILNHIYHIFLTIVTLCVLWKVQSRFAVVVSSSALLYWTRSAIPSLWHLIHSFIPYVSWYTSYWYWNVFTNDFCLDPEYNHTFQKLGGLNLDKVCCLLSWVWVLCSTLPRFYSMVLLDECCCVSHFLPIIQQVCHSTFRIQYASRYLVTGSYYYTY